MLLRRQRKPFLPLPHFPWNPPISYPLFVCSLNGPDIVPWLGHSIHTISWTTMAFLTAYSVGWSQQWVTGDLRSSWEDSRMQPRLYSTKFCWEKASFVPNTEQGTMQKQSLRYHLHFLFYFQSLNESYSTKSFLGSYSHPWFTPPGSYG